MKFLIDTAELRPLVEAVVAEAVSAIQRSGLDDDGRLAYPEPEAAQLLGLASHQLRDARLRGEITATKLGGRIGYERGELIDYLARGRQS